MKIAIGADHAGYELKEKLKHYLKDKGHEVVDAGAQDYDQADDYPDFGIPVAEMVANGEADRGVLVCDTGIGMDIVANKFPGVRSALVHDEELARRTREHNDTNVLSLGAMLLDEATAKHIADIWLETEFSGADRHIRRIEEIRDLERQEMTCLK